MSVDNTLIDLVGSVANGEVLYAARKVFFRCSYSNTRSCERCADVRKVRANPCAIEIGMDSALSGHR